MCTTPRHVSRQLARSRSYGLLSANRTRICAFELDTAGCGGEVVFVSGTYERGLYIFISVMRNLGIFMGLSNLKGL